MTRECPRCHHGWVYFDGYENTCLQCGHAEKDEAALAAAQAAVLADMKRGGNTGNVRRERRKPGLPTARGSTLPKRAWGRKQ